MALVKYSPVTPSLRGTVLFKPEVTKKAKPHKSLLRKKSSSGGRDNRGRTTSRFRGGGHKQRYRLINFKKNKDLFDVPAIVESLQYDPNRTATIALIKYENDSFEYMVAPEGLKVGDRVITSRDNMDINIGNTMPLFLIPIGTSVHNIELKPGAGAVMSRSAGAYAVLSSKEGGKAVLTLPSKEKRIIDSNCFATIGVVSNAQKKNEKIGKAGRSRWLGRRPHVRGVVMNPVDHPMGGGEGKSSGGRHPCSPTGQKSKGLRTRRNKRTDAYILVRRYVNKKK